MAFGDRLGTLTGNAISITNPFDATGSVVVAVGDLVVGVLTEQISNTVTAASDNLGNSYSAVSAGTDAGNVCARTFYSRVTVAGTLTFVRFTATASNNNVVANAVAYQGPFTAPPLDQAPADGTEGGAPASPFDCPATGTLSQADELVVCWGSRLAVSSAVWSCTSPLLKDLEAFSSTVVSNTIGSKVVSSTTTTTPQFTSGTNPAGCVLGTATFLKGSTNKVLAAGAGAYTFTGTAATLTKGHPIAAGAGSYALTGTAASLLHKWKPTALAGSYVLTGTAASLLRKRLLTAGAGSYALTGTAATLRRNLPLVAGAGSYALTGTAASLLHGWKLAAAAGSYALTGATAGLTKSSSVGKVLIAGGNACTYDSLNTSPNITLSNGSRTLEQISANAFGDSSRSVAHHSTGVYYNETLINEAAGTDNVAVGVCNSSFDLTNNPLGDANSAGYYSDGNIYTTVSILNTGVTYTTGDRIGVEIDVGAKTMRVRKNGGSWSSLADVSFITGDFYFAGFVFTIGVSAKLTTNFGETAYVDTPPVGASDWTTVTPASYVLSGTDVNVRQNRIVAAGAGSYALTGTNATLLHGWKLAADAGSYSLTGTAASLLHGQSIVVDGGTYTITGSAAALRRALKLSAGSGAYNLTGSDVSLVWSGSTPSPETFVHNLPIIVTVGKLLTR